MRDYVIILILFSVIVGLLALVISDLSSVNNGYNVPNITDSSFDGTYNKLENTTSLINTGANETSGGLGNLLGGADVFFSSTVTIFSLVFNSFGLVSGVFASFITSFGIPLPIANLIFPAVLSIITAIIIFVVISSLTKTKV